MKIAASLTSVTKNWKDSRRVDAYGPALPLTPNDKHWKTVMTERLVDVIDSRGAVLHTYPVTLGEAGTAADDCDYQAKALEAAAQGRLVPDAELGTLTARMHTSRGGQMAPYGDDVEKSSETKLGLEQAVRERAYLLWETNGRPDGRAEEFWHRALDEHLRERAYVLWQQEGCPEGREEEYWRQLVQFQAQ
jgi:Protein of unknown function (DUF2934)